MYKDIMKNESLREPQPRHLKIGKQFKISPQLDNPRPRGIYLVLDEMPIHLNGIGDGTITVSKTTTYPPGYVDTPAGLIDVNAQMTGNALTINPETAPISIIFSLLGNLKKLRDVGIELDIDGKNYKGILTESINNRLGVEEGEIDFFKWQCPFPSLDIKPATQREKAIFEDLKQSSVIKAMRPVRAIKPSVGTLFFPNDPQAFKRASFKFVSKS